MLYRIQNTLERFLTILALIVINRARGLTGKILTEVVRTDRTQWGLYPLTRSRYSHIERLRWVNKMFIICKQEQSNPFNLINWFVIVDILLANSDELKWNLSKFARCTIFYQALCYLHNIFYKKIVIFSLSEKCNRSKCLSRWDLDRSKYWF